MRFTVIVDDKLVYKDGEGVSPVTFHDSLDLSSVHAIQWYDTWGEVEYKEIVKEGVLTKPPNLIINDFSPYASILDAWKDAMNKMDEERALAEQIQHLADGD